MTSYVHVAGTGARTPLGIGVAPSAAALRAGISGMAEHPFMIDHLGDPMAGAIDPILDPGMIGPDRLVALAESALREACMPLSDVAKSRPRMPVYVGLPELRPGFEQWDAEAVGSALGRLEGLPIEISEVRIATQGHAVGLLAFADAVEQLRRGAFDMCLVGGVDSYFQPDTMEWLDENRQLAGADSRSGFVPGEGAGFCLLLGSRARERLDLASSAWVIAVGTGRETKLIKTPDLCVGEGLTAAVQTAVAGLDLPSERINDVICDINSERYRSEEWGFVCLRLAQYFDDPTAFRSPADSWGDMGAASAPLFVMLACQAAVHEYARGPRSMLWASSEGGLRGAAVLGLETTSGTS